VKSVRVHRLPIAILWGATLLAYINSFQAGFVFDNGPLLLQDPRIRAGTSSNVDLIFNQEYWYNNSTSGLYRPLATLSYLFNYAILGNGTQPAGYHAVNLALHAVNVLLLYLLLLDLLPAGVAFAAALLWAVHPILTESVTNTIGRTDLLAAFGVLAGLLAHRQVARTERRTRLLWLGALFAAAAVGFFSKESAIVLLGVMLAHDLAFDPAARRRTLPGYAAAGLAALWFLTVRASVLAHVPYAPLPFTDNPLLGTDFWTSRLVALGVIARYFALLLWPAQLSCDYSFHQIPLAWDMHSAIGLLLVAAAAALAVCSYRRNRALSFFIAFFFITLAPTSNLVILIGSIMAERFLYLPAIAFSVGVAIAGQALLRRVPVRAQAAILALVCAALALRTYTRNADWTTDLTLWSAAAQVSPESYKAHVNYASFLAGSKGENLDAALPEIDRSLAILGPLPDVQNSARTWASAGFCYRVKGDRSGAAARPWYEKARDTLLRATRIDQARADLTRSAAAAIGRAPSVSITDIAYLELARVYRRLGDPRRAMDVLTYISRQRSDPAIQRELATIQQDLARN
jgi:tetratricopeptide (TPR) repeat protein